MAEKKTTERNPVKKMTETSKELAKTVKRLDSEIMYEEATGIYADNKEMIRILQKTPYLDFGGHKIYLSRTETEAIRAGKMKAQDILDTIEIKETYKR